MKSYQELTTEFDINMEQLLEQASEVNRFIACNPELSGEEEKSALKHIEFLEQTGMKVEQNYCGIKHAYFANVVKKENAKYKMLIISEYDALPEIGHGCGHSASGTISILAASCLHKMADNIDVDIDIIGTPDEEYNGEKVTMVKQGIFDQYDFAMMVHMGSGLSTANYKIISLSAFRVKFKGLSSHAAAAPFKGKNALDAATILMTSCGLLRQQLKPGSIVSYYVVNGGSVSNSIADQTELEFLVRHEKNTYLQQIKSRITDCIKGAALCADVDYEVNYVGNEFFDMPFYKTGTEVVGKVFDELDIPNVPEIPINISTDIGNVGYCCPTMHPILSVSEKNIPLHTTEMAAQMLSENIDKIIANGSKLVGHTFLSFIDDKEKFEDIKQEFVQIKNQQEV